MNVDEVVRALRWLARDTDFVFAEEQLNAAADLIESLQAEVAELQGKYDKLNDFEQSECANLLEKHRWIPVTERLPEHGESVLTYIRHSHVVYGRDDGFRAYRVYEFDGHFIGMGNLCEVVAWIPLPEPPKEVAE
jgi:hypothetical protein